MPPNHFESEVESFLEGSHGDRTHIKRADHHTVTPLCGTLLHKHSTPRNSRPVDKPRHEQTAVDSEARILCLAPNCGGSINNGRG